MPCRTCSMSTIKTLRQWKVTSFSSLPSTSTKLTKTLSTLISHFYILQVFSYLNTFNQKRDRSLFIPVTPLRFVPAIIYLFKVNKRKIREKCQMRSKLRLKTLDRLQWRRSRVFPQCILSLPPENMRKL